PSRKKWAPDTHFTVLNRPFTVSTQLVDSDLYNCDRSNSPLHLFSDGTKLTPCAGGFLETGCGRPQCPAGIQLAALQVAVGRPHVSVHVRCGSIYHASAALLGTHPPARSLRHLAGQPRCRRGTAPRFH